MAVKAIDAENVKSLFERMRMKPTRGEGPNSACGCILECMHAAAGYPDEGYMAWAGKEFGTAYTDGVMDGWDFKYGDDDTVREDDEYLRGFSDGHAAAKIMFVVSISGQR